MTPSAQVSPPAARSPGGIALLGLMVLVTSVWEPMAAPLGTEAGRKLPETDGSFDEWLVNG